MAIWAFPDVRHALVKIGFSGFIVGLGRLRLGGRHAGEGDHAGDRGKLSEKSAHRHPPPLVCTQLAADREGGNMPMAELAFLSNRSLEVRSSGAK